MDCRYERGDELRHAEVRFEPLRRDGTVTGVHGSVQDVTERTRQEVRTDLELEIRARLLDLIDAAVIATDREGMVTHWNRAAERMYGWTAAESVRQAGPRGRGTLHNPLDAALFGDVGEDDHGPLALDDRLSEGDHAALVEGIADLPIQERPSSFSRASRSLPRPR
jgi:PAS domain-containing protein